MVAYVALRHLRVLFHFRYKLMRLCWCTEPNLRQTFTFFEKELGDLLLFGFGRGRACNFQKTQSALHCDAIVEEDGRK